MSSRNIEFFSTLEEYADLIYELISEFKLNLLLRESISKLISDDNWETEYFHLINPGKKIFLNKIINKKSLIKIYLSNSPFTEDQLDPTETMISKWQWISGLVPELRDNNELSSSFISARSDWYISEDDYGDNRDIFDLFSKIKRRILKRLKKPMWIIFSPTDYRLIRDVGYSKGAEEFVKHGGILKGYIARCEHALQEPKPQPK